MMNRSPSLTKIATEIDRLLREIERDPQKNPAHPRPISHVYRNVSAKRRGNIVEVHYRPAHCDRLDRAAALRYLRWLEAGNVGFARDAEKAAEVAREREKADASSGGEVMSVDLALTRANEILEDDDGDPFDLLQEGMDIMRALRDEVVRLRTAQGMVRG